MSPEAITLYLAANGVHVADNTDNYFRLSPDGIKEWSVEVKQPTEEDLAPYEIEAKTPPASAVKAEAGRRILSLMPEWKQRNYTARMTELLKIRTVNGTWTTEEQAEVDFLEGEWAKAKAIREASDTIEKMTPIPVDYTDDKYWP